MDSNWQQQGSYPDPTDDEADAGPYPILSRANYESRGDAPNSAFPRPSYPDREDADQAARQYSLLANHLNLTQGRNNQSDISETAGDFEGIPLANTYLNLHPVKPASIQYETVAEDTDFATDAEVATDAEAATDRETAAETADESTATTGAKKGRKRGWKWALKGTAHDPRLNREKKTAGRPKGSVNRRKRVKSLDPGRVFKEKQAKATKAFIDGRLDEALEFALAAIQANPEIWAAHAVLADILLAKGQEQDSLAALLSGAVTARDANTWIMVAERTLEYAGDDRSADLLQQAVFCYTQAIELEKPDQRLLDARHAKLLLWIELGESSKARRDCKQLVTFLPHDIELARLLAELSLQTEDKAEATIARKVFEEALDAYYQHSDTWTDEEIGQAWEYLNVYVELIQKLVQPEEAISLLKRRARTILGRSDETFWDSYNTNDCELDLTHTRRYEIGEFQQGLASRDTSKYGETLPLELRVKLGIFRLGLGTDHDKAEALGHFEQVLQYSDDAEDWHDLFTLIGSSLQEKGLAQEAIKYFEPMLEIDMLTDETWSRYAHCLEDIGQFEKAAESFKKAIQLNPTSIAIKVDLAHLYEKKLNDKENAYRIVDEIVALNQRDVLRREKLSTRPKQRARVKKSIAPNRSTTQPTDDNQSSESDDPRAEFIVEDGYSRKKPLSKEVRSRISRMSRTETFVPAGPGQYSGFSLTDPNANMSVEELALQERAMNDASDHDDDYSVSERNSEDDSQPEEPRERLWRAKEKKSKKKKSQTKPARAKTLDQLESLADTVYKNHKIVTDLWPDFTSGEDQAIAMKWLEAAHSLYSAFRSFKQFYPTRDKNIAFKGFLRLGPGELKFMTEMESWKKQLEADEDEEQQEQGEKDENYSAPRPPDASVPKDFYNIRFAEWHHIFTDMVLWYAHKGNRRACYKILDDGIFGANVFFHDAELLNTSQATSMCCAFIFNDSERLCFAARWFINRHDHRSGQAYQLLAGVNRLSFGNSLWFSAGPTQKHMLRAIKTLDHHMFDPATRKKFDWSLQAVTLKKRVEKYGEDAGYLDTTALLTYGHMVGVANHSQSALPYFFRAFALEPENVTVNLSIATMYIQNAMKRQTDNRQYGIAQGLSFLSRYYDLRTASGGAIDKQEAEFNCGRAWHMLGLTHISIQHYERALALSEAVQAEGKKIVSSHVIEDFATEAAFAMVSIFALSGNDEAARQLTEKWLVL